MKQNITYSQNVYEYNNLGMYGTSSIYGISVDQLKVKRNRLIEKYRRQGKVELLVFGNIKETIENKSDLLYEVFDHTDRIHGLEDHIDPIMKESKKKDIKVSVAEKERDNTLEHIIPQGSLNTSTDLVESLTNLVKRSGGFKNFIVVRKETPDGCNYIELLEETGGS